MGEIQPNSITGEFYLTDMAEILRQHGHAVRALHIDDPAELLGINTRVELADADRILRQRKTRELMLAGVTIERPETVTIDASVSVGTDTVIEPFARLLGQPASAKIAASARGRFLNPPCWPIASLMRPYTVIADSRIDAARKSARSRVCAWARTPKRTRASAISSS